MLEYWRNHLENGEEKFYTEMYQAFSRGEASVRLNGIEPERLFQVYFAVYEDHPELFNLTSAPEISCTEGPFGKTCILNSHPIYDKMKKDACERKIKFSIAEFKREASAAATDEDKVIAAADYLVRRVKYEIDNQFNQNAASALAFGKAQCSGISKAFKLLLDEIGIFCITANGDAVDDSGNMSSHGWNIVRLGSEHYHVDVTYMLGANMQKKEPLVRIFLFYDDASILKTRKFTKPGLPSCNDSSKMLDGTPGRGYTASSQPPAGGLQNKISQFFSYFGRGGQASGTPAGTGANTRQSPKPNIFGARNSVPAGQRGANTSAVPGSKPAPAPRPTPPLPNNATRYGALYEIRAAIKRTVENREGLLVFAFENKNFTREQLFRAVLSACDSEIKTFGIKIEANVSLRGDSVFEITFKY